MQNKTALVTGANRGIGKACVRSLAEHGANIIAHARNKNPEYLQFLDEIEQQYSVSVTPIFFDMTDSRKMRDVMKELILSKKNIDVLVNCAGLGHGVSFQRTTLKQIREICDINLFSHMELTQLVLRSMCRQKSGSIINIGSISGLDLSAGNCAYGTSKAALMAFTKTLACELGVFGIRVNCVAPGLTDTEMGHSVKDFAIEDMLKDSILGRFALPKEVSDVVVYLASDKSSFINGQIIRVDGGSV